jgi:hypothetical protein
VDLARHLMTEMERGANQPQEEEKTQTMSRELTAAQRRMLMLIRALRAFYISLGGFASATLLSVIGAALTPSLQMVPALALEIAAIASGVVAVASMVRGAVLLLRETRVAVDIMEERVKRTQEKFARGGAPDANDLLW